MHHVRQRGNQLGFAESGHAFEQNVAAGEQAHDHAIDDVVVADDDFRDFCLTRLNCS